MRTEGVEATMRYDTLVLNSGAGVALVRARLEKIDPGTEPVILVRRQDVGSATWHRLGFNQLLEAIASADDDAVLSELVDLDAGNEVPVVAVEELTGRADPYGVLMLGAEVIGFSEGYLEEAALEGPTRGKAPELGAAMSVDEALTMPSPEETVSAGTDFGAFPVINSPKTVEPDQMFEVAVGVDAERLRHTVSKGIEVTDLDPYLQTVRLQVDLVGPGFEIVTDSTDLPELKIDRQTLDHEPVTFRITSTEPPSTYDPKVGAWTARLTATFWLDGAIVGEGYREIRVNQSRARHIERRSNDIDVGEGEVPPPVADGTDLIIWIENDDSTGNYTVRVSSQHLSKPVRPARISLGDDAKGFAAQLVSVVDTSIADEVSDEMLAYIGQRITEQIPGGVVQAIIDVWNALNGPEVDEVERRPPDLLLLTDDCQVPWELMEIHLDESKPPFLGAQVNIGRWPNEYRHKLQPGPVGVKQLGVMVGHYSKNARLPRAEEEGRLLEEQYEARKVDADSRTFDLLLSGKLADDFEIEALHFAGHGKSDPNTGTYLMYSDGSRMNTHALGAAAIARNKSAFVFVNACQVGTAKEMLGNYAGLAGTAVHAGFRGFVAPLWSVDDDIAKEVALGLYRTSADGQPISSYLREVRAQFEQTPDEVAHTTHMAYVFYGHPGLQLGGPNRRKKGAGSLA